VTFANHNILDTSVVQVLYQTLVFYHFYFNLVIFQDLSIRNLLRSNSPTRYKDTGLVYQQCSRW